MGRARSGGRAAAFLAGTAALAVSVGAVAGGFPYRVLHRIPIGHSTPVAALAIPADGARLYAAVGEEVRSFDARSGEPREAVKLPGRAAALAVSNTAPMLYAAVASPARLVMLGLDPLRIIRSVVLRTGAPTELLFDPIAHTLFAESRSARTIVRLDPRTGRRLGLVHLPGTPEQMAGNGRATLYVANAAADAIDVIDAIRMRKLGAIPTPDCKAPSGLAMDPMGRRLFVACGNGRALVIDTDMGFPFEQLPIGRGTRLRAVFALRPGPARWKGGAFITGSDAQLDAIRMMAFIRYVSAGRLPLARPCTATALSPASSELWLALAPERASAPGTRHEEAGAELLALGARSREASP